MPTFVSGVYGGVRGDLQYGYRSRTFKEFPLLPPIAVLPISRIPSLIVLHELRELREPDFRIFLPVVCFCAIFPRAILMYLCQSPLFSCSYPRSSASTRRACHDQFSIPESFNIYIFFTITEKHFNVASLYKIILNVRMESSFIVLKAQFYEHYKYPLKLKINLD